MEDLNSYLIINKSVQRHHTDQDAINEESKESAMEGELFKIYSKIITGEMLAQPLDKEIYASMKSKQYNESIFGKLSFRNEYIKQYKVATSVPQPEENGIAQLDLAKLSRL